MTLTKIKMTKIEINNVMYYIHPIYNLYAADEFGNVINIIKKKTYKW